MTSAALHGQSAGTRDTSLDAFRGLAVGGMILVNLQGNGGAAWAHAVHAPWHGLTLADLVFPFFLLAVGMSVALVAQRQAVPGMAEIGKRALLLFLLGLALGWLLRPSLHPDLIRLPGVLQRIAVCFAAVAVWSHLGQTWAHYLLLAAGALLLHWILLLVPAPGELMPSMAPGGGFSGWSDRLLPGRLHGGTYDPEGVLSTLSAIATTALGACTWQIRRMTGTLTGLAWGSGLVLIAGVMSLGFAMPLNKALWTPSFAVFAAGAGTLVWLTLAGWCRHAPLAPFLVFLCWMGRVALTFYVVHMVLIAGLRIPLGAGRLWDSAWAAAAAALGPSGFVSMLFAVVAGALCLAVTRWLERRHCLLKI